MMTPWGRIGGSQENVRDLGPLAEMVKFAGGLPGAAGGSKYRIYGVLHNLMRNIMKSKNN